MSCTQQVLAVFSMERDLPGREGKPHFYRQAAITVPAKLNFLDRVIKAAQKNLLTHTLSAKAEL